MTCHDLYLKSTDARGCITFSEHRVWSADRFMAARNQEAAIENAKARQDDPDRKADLAKVEQLTDDQFKARQ